MKEKEVKNNHSIVSSDSKINHRKHFNINKSVSKELWVIYFVWPFAAFLFALKNYNKAWAPKIFMAFTTFFGFTLVQYGDTYSISSDLKEIHNSGIQFETLITSYFEQNSNSLDIVYQIIIFIIAQFTSDPRFLFAILAFIFAYYITKSVWLLLQYSEIKEGKLSGLMLIAFALIIQVWYIGGRWNLAAIVFGYGAIQYIYLNKKRYLMMIFFSILIHWSFLIVVPLLLVYLVLKNRTTVYYVLFITTFFFNVVNLNETKDVFKNYAPVNIEQSKGSYFLDDYVEAQNIEKERLNWYVWGHVQALNLFILAMASYLFFKQQSLLKKNKLLFNLFNFSLLFFGVTSALSSIPNMERFFRVGQLLFLAVFFLFLQQLKGRVPIALNIFGRISLFIFIVVRIRVGFDYFSGWTLFGNPFIVYFVENEIPLIEFIKLLLKN